LEEYPTPWKVVQMTVGVSIEAANGKTIVNMGEKLAIAGMLEFIAETINNSIKIQTVNTLSKCSCSWQGIIQEWSPYPDNNGNLLCPHCARIVKVA